VLIRVIRGHFFCFILKKDTVAEGSQANSVNNDLVIVERFMQDNRLHPQFSALIMGCILLYPERNLGIK